MTIQNANDLVINNDDELQPLDATTGIRTVIGNGTYNFLFTPVSGKAIASVTVNGEKLPVADYKVTTDATEAAITETASGAVLTYADGVASCSMMLEE